MAKQIINIGATANDKKGDSLRAAFQKVNTNFTELYTTLGLNDTTLNLGAFEFTGNIISTTDSTAIVIDQAATITSNLSVGGDILPQTANGGDLGSSSLPWRSLHVSNNTIYIGGTALSIDGSGNLTVNGSQVTGVSVSSLVNSTKTVSLGSNGMLTLPGTVTFPDTTIQSTAWTGSSSTLTDGVFIIDSFQASTQIATWTAGATNMSPTDSISFFGHSSKPFDTTWTISGSGITGQSAITAINPIMSGMSITGYTVTIAQTISTGLVTGDYVFSNPPSTQGVNLSSDLSTWTFGSNGTLTLPADIASHSWIEPAGNTLSLYKRIGNASSHVTQTANRWENIVQDQDTGNYPAYASIYAELPTIDTPAVSISARQGTSGNTSQWVFGADGKLVLPEVGTLSNSGYDWTFGTDGTLTFPTGVTLAGSVLTSNPSTDHVTLVSADTHGSQSSIDVSGSGGIRINTFYNNVHNQWLFNSNGGMLFPSNSIRSAASLKISTNYIAAVGPITGVISAPMVGDDYMKVSSEFGGGGSNMFAGINLSDLIGGILTVGGIDNTILDITPLGNAEYSVHISGPYAGSSGGGNNSLSILVAERKVDWTFGTDGTLTLAGPIIAPPSNNNYTDTIIDVNINALVNKLVPQSSTGAPHYRIPPGTEGQIMYLVPANIHNDGSEATSVTFDNARWSSGPPGGPTYISEGARPTWIPFEASSAVVTIIYAGGAWNLPS